MFRLWLFRYLQIHLGCSPNNSLYELVRFSGSCPAAKFTLAHASSDADGLLSTPICPNPNLQITEVWLKYVRPWRYQFDVNKGQAIAQPFSASHVEFVRSNAVFYTTLIQAVLSQTEYMDLTYDRRMCVSVDYL
jgi:hypothetical protein